MTQPHHDSGSHDKHFYDSFMLVLGGLIGVAIVLIFLAQVLAKPQNEAMQKDERLQLAISERLAPVGKVAVSGQDNSALAPAQPAKPAAAAADLPGDQVYNSACVACHGQGLAGAPKMGDKAAWAPRIAQGMPTLYKHAIDGFQGKAGLMPAKGARADLSDKSVSASVDYMVGASK